MSTELPAEPVAMVETVIAEEVVVPTVGEPVVVIVSETNTETPLISKGVTAVEPAVAPVVVASSPLKDETPNLPVKVTPAKDEATSEEANAETLENVTERLAFFFSSANLRIDRFLRKLVLGDDEGDASGFVPISTLLRFNTIKKHTTSSADVVAAVKGDALKHVLKLNDDQTEVARVVPFTEDMMKDNIKLSLRVDGIPITKEGEEGKAQHVITRQQLEEFFAVYGKVALVKMLYTRSDAKQTTNHDSEAENNTSKHTMPSRTQHQKSHPYPLKAAFVEFETINDLNKAAADLCGTEPKAAFKVKDEHGNEVALKIQTMEKWIEEKEAEKSKGNGSQKRDRNEEENGDNDDDKATTKEEGEKDHYKDFTLDWKKGCAIRIKGLPQDCDRETICSVIAQFMGKKEDGTPVGGSAYADYSRGQPDGAIRFAEECDKIAEFAAKLTDGSILIGGKNVDSAHVMEGEGEVNYYNEFINFKNKQLRIKFEERARKRVKNNGGGRGGGGRGRGRGGGRFGKR